MPFPYDLSTPDKSVTLNATDSSMIDLGGMALGVVVIPGGLVSTSLSFTVSYDKGATFVPLKDDLNNLVSISVGNTAAAYNLRRILPIALGQVKIVPSSVSDAGKVLTVICQQVV